MYDEGKWPSSPKKIQNNFQALRETVACPKNDGLRVKTKLCSSPGIVALQDACYRIKIGYWVLDICCLTPLQYDWNVWNFYI